MKKTSKRNSDILKEWNRGSRNMAEIGEMFGVSKSAVSGVLWRARQNGLFVMSVNPSQGACRMHESMRRRVGDEAYMAILRQRGTHMNAVRWGVAP